MASREEVVGVLPELGRDGRVKLKLDDGTEVVGTLYGLFDGLVHFEEEDLEPLEVGRIDRLLIRRITEGPGLPAG